METIRQIIQDSVSAGFWTFAGHWLMVFLILGIPAKLRHWNIRRHGYPPKHCDVDGDFVNSEKENPYPWDEK